MRIAECDKKSQEIGIVAFKPYSYLSCRINQFIIKMKNYRKNLLPVLAFFVIGLASCSNDDVVKYSTNARKRFNKFISFR